MTDPFYSPRIRLNRAKEHITELEWKIRAYMATRPYTKVVEPAPDGVTQLHKFKLVGKFPNNLTTIAVDAISNLRSALDHTGFACALAAGITDSKSAYFPFADSAAGLEEVIKGRCKDIPARILKLFRSFKPYKGGNDLLWALNKLRASNEHRLIVPVGTVLGGVVAREWSLSWNHPGGVGHSGWAPTMPPIWDTAKDEMIFAAKGPGINVDYDIDFAFGIAFDQSQPFPLGGHEVIGALHELVYMVNGIIRATKKEARGIKPAIYRF